MRPAIEHIKEKLYIHKDCDNTEDCDILGVEVGVWKGDHSQEILDSLPNCKLLYLVDPWCDYPVYSDWNRNKYGDEKWKKWKKFDWEALHFSVIKRFQNNLRASIMRGLSHMVAGTFKDEAVDFVYVDGSHEYTTVSADLRVWWPKIRAGGVLCGHDHWGKQPGVVKAVNEFAEQQGVKLNLSGEKDWWIDKD